MKWIVNQDRDKVYKYAGIDYFHIEYVYHNGLCIAFNLWYRDGFLGTFDSIEECVSEIYSIVLFKGVIYFVNGYAEFDC